jgi:Family of unknown function (DUF5647)
MNYNTDMIVEKNMTLSFEFERYAQEHPEILDQIPDQAEVVLLPQDDPELYRINLESAQKNRTVKDAAPIVYVEIEAIAPPRSRLVNPHVIARPTPART